MIEFFMSIVALLLALLSYRLGARDWPTLRIDDPVKDRAHPPAERLYDEPSTVATSAKRTSAE